MNCIKTELQSFSIKTFTIDWIVTINILSLIKFVVVLFAFILEWHQMFRYLCVYVCEHAVRCHYRHYWSINWMMAMQIDRWAQLTVYCNAYMFMYIFIYIILHVLTDIPIYMVINRHAGVRCECKSPKQICQWLNYLCVY